MHENLRSLPLAQVLGQMGLSEWKSRKDGSEWLGKCPVHGSKSNSTVFSFDIEGRYHCFSCGAKGRGAIDLVMAVRKVGFQDAVSYLQSFVGSSELLEEARKPAIKLVQEMPTANEPFNATYEKFAVESPWLEKRGLTPETLS